MNVIFLDNMADKKMTVQITLYRKPQINTLFTKSATMQNTVEKSL